VVRHEAQAEPDAVRVVLGGRLKRHHRGGDAGAALEEVLEEVSDLPAPSKREGG
jgi:hypothetical protein